ncbi:PREDICTED: LOC109949210 [Prunus dulcis]|uniref:PREDICTED: LOC109949210 n=1 Tax=Prunus dulcis TaxID=3755 RepID=A0A5E4G0G6_PRUDU|nr:PREDICTED: LOC109949210 [Prunus dulcis]
MLIWISFCTLPQSTVHFRSLTTTTQNRTIRRSSTSDRTVAEPETTAPNHKTPRVAHPKPSLIHPKSPTSFPFSRAIPQLEKAKGKTFYYYIELPGPPLQRRSVPFRFSKLSQWLLLLLLWIPEKLQIRSVELCLCSRKSTNQSSREASELRLKRQVIGKCDRRMLLATYCPSNRRASNGFVKTTKNLKVWNFGGPYSLQACTF